MSDKLRVEKGEVAGITRRHFLKTSALAGAGLMTGCLRKKPEGVIFKGWPYEPDLVRKNIEYFAQQSNIDVAYEGGVGQLPRQDGCVICRQNTDGLLLRTR